ncbi:hypothetical protein SAMN05192554_12438 [Haloarchaeobius iranensis]|uniref:Uncharacterized protein n=1 Tax=Haloarchaeobius iranensis TaxID=996166 RepID=A0A1H0A577_9EURY|nr:hypothetical protein SAMN05192554_12438 [Haloarchaeobius iranensis]
MVQALRYVVWVAKTEEQTPVAGVDDTNLMSPET